MEIIGRRALGKTANDEVAAERAEAGRQLDASTTERLLDAIRREHGELPSRLRGGVEREQGMGGKGSGTEGKLCENPGEWDR